MKKNHIQSKISRHLTEFAKHLFPLLLVVSLASLMETAYSEEEKKKDDKSLLSKIASGDVDATADKLEFVGTNIVGTDNVVVKYGDILITCDKVIVNITTKDVLAQGHVRFLKRSTAEREIDYWDLKELEENPNMKVTVVEHVTNPYGRQRLRVSVTEESDVWEGERAEGNLGTGVFELGKYKGRFGVYYCIGESAERDPDGSITVRDARASTCEYLMENHDHYSITASRIKLIPTEDNIELGAKTQDKFEAWAYNCVFWIGNVPILWAPIMYKPGKGSFGWGVQAGKDYDWGYYVKTRKTFRLMEYPYITGTLLADWYSRRGFGVGTEIKASEDSSYTEGFLYWIYDRDPQMYEGRFNIDPNRYEIKLSHLNHLYPRMDFRGQIDVLSDINFISDFFRRRFQRDPQPTSFANLDYQFDHLTVSAYLRPRINDFFSVVESLPELRIDIPRQELFKNIYYQGETTYSYLRMKWRDYDKPRTAGNKVDPKDYDSQRFDTLHMFYYPFSVEWLNVIPRAGLRLTYYSKSSKKKINQNDVNTFFIEDNQGQGDGTGDVVNYDSKGGQRFRFTGEIGFELNTKIYRSWNNVKNAFLQLDGLRHVMIPYLNYNFIPSPTVNRDHIYYFDDIDRINEQNFVRLGVKNRLETRRGAIKREQIYTWATMENYFDFHFNREKGFKNMGDFGTIFEFNPSEDFKITSDILIDPGAGNFNKFRTNFIYNITKKWKTFARYNYQNDYEQRGTYSMGSSLADINSGTAFSRSYGKNHDISAGLEFPINEKTRGEVSLTYSITNNALEEGRIRLIRTLHCWELALEYALRQRKTDMGQSSNQHNFMFMIYLTAAPGFKIQARQSYGGQQGGDDDGGGGSGGNTD